MNYTDDYITFSIDIFPKNIKIESNVENLPFCTWGIDERKLNNKLGVGISTWPQKERDFLIWKLITNDIPKTLSEGITKEGPYSLKINDSESLYLLTRSKRNGEVGTTCHLFILEGEYGILIEMFSNNYNFYPELCQTFLSSIKVDWDKIQNKMLAPQAKDDHRHRIDDRIILSVSKLPPGFVETNEINCTFLFLKPQIPMELRCLRIVLIFSGFSRSGQIRNNSLSSN